MGFEISNIFQLILRTTLTFIVLLTLTRLLGKKQLSQLTFFNYVTGITIGSISSNIISSNSERFMDDFIGLIWWCLLTIIIGYINLKSGSIRRIVDGEPTILIKKGEIIKKSLHSNRLNMDDLSMLLRKQSIFSITEVEYAILEPNGNLSIMKKPKYQNITKEDMKIPTNKTNFIPSEIIVDGKLIEKNLKELNLSNEWLNGELKKHNIKSIQDIFYAEIQNNKTLFINLYDDK